MPNFTNDNEDKVEIISLSARFDTFWPRFREVTAFVGGFGIMVFESLADKSDRPWLYAAAIGMMGLPIARYAEGTLTKWGSNKPGPVEAPPDSTSGNTSSTLRTRK